MILTLGFQTILPAQIALMSARGVNTPLGWYIVIAQMAGVLLAFMLVGGLVAALRICWARRGAGPGAGIWRSSTALSRCA
jgi:Trk-type K+ transport system membrane component